MSKINLDTFKKLLNVKKGGAEFFRLVVKIVFWMLAIGVVISVVYSLDEIQKTEKIKLNVMVEKLRTEVLKIERQCSISARTNLDLAMKNAKKDGKKIDDKDKKIFLENAYFECMYLNGFNMPQKK